MNDPIWELTDSAVVLPTPSRSEMKSCLLNDLRARVIGADQALDRIDYLGLWPRLEDEDYESWSDLCRTLNDLAGTSPRSFQDNSGRQEGTGAL